MNPLFFRVALIPFISLDISSFTPDISTPINKLIFYILLYSIISLWLLLDIIFYFGSLYITHYYNDYILTKYPRLKPIIKYYRNKNHILIIVDIIFLIVMYIALILLCISALYKF